MYFYTIINFIFICILHVYVNPSTYSKYRSLVIPLKASERATPPFEPILLLLRLGVAIIIDNYKYV